MAQKDYTYLRFGGGTTERRGNTQGAWYGGQSSSFVFTIFVRLLEWPATCAPIIQQGGDASNTAQWGLFWYNNCFNASNRGPNNEQQDDLCLGIQWSVDSGPVIEELVSIEDTTGVPAKLGNIYQIQLVLFDDASRVRVGVFVDGVSVHQNSQLGDIPTAAAGETVRVGYPSEDGFDGTDEEPTCMDIIQFMYEEDRTITKTGSNIDPPDGALDPWEELAVDGSASGGTANNLNEASGSPSGFQFTNPSWADATKVDPQLDEDAGTIDWTFENIFGYSESKPDAYPQPIFAPVGDRTDPTAGELRLRLKPCVWSEHGELGADQWTSTYALGTSTAQEAITDNSILAAATVAGNSASTGAAVDHGGASSDGQGRWFRCWHYDKGGTSSDIINRIQVTGGNANWMGVLFSQSTSEYATNVGTHGAALTGVSRTTGWHEWVMWIENGVIGNSKCKIWLDGTLVRDIDDPADAGDGNTQPNTRTRSALAADQFHVDWWHWNRQDGDTPAEFQGLVASTAQVILPSVNPTGVVESFDSVTIVDEAAGDNSMEVGTLTYDFRHNGGSWQTLNDTNLQAITPVGTGGGDTIEVRVTLDSGMEDCASPACRSIQINYTPGGGIIPQIMVMRQMAGSC